MSNFSMSKIVREDDTLTTIQRDGCEVASINYASKNLGGTEYSVEVAIHFIDGIYVIEKWEHISTTPERYLKGYIQELLRFLSQFDTSKVSINSETSDKVIEKLQSLSSDMLASKAKNYDITNIGNVDDITIYIITKCK